MKDAMDLMAKNAANGSVGANLNKMTSAESMAALIRNQQLESGSNFAGRCVVSNYFSLSRLKLIDIIENTSFWVPVAL